MTSQSTPNPSLVLLAALGVLCIGGASAAEVDTSQWKCEKCPDVNGTKGSVEVGAGYVSEGSTTFGNYTGLRRSGGHLVAGGVLGHLGDDGYSAELEASDLGLETRSLAARTGRAGLYSLRLGYTEIPRYFAEGAQTPFDGNGGSTLVLPAGAGFPAATTAAMPLAATLRSFETGFKAKRLDLGGAWVGQEHWTYRVSLRRDTKDGTKPTAGSFFSTTSQLVMPVDQTTDQFEVAAAYADERFQATLAYQLSRFRNGNESLTWDNPFLPVVAGATQGQLALAPNNRFQQIVATVGYQITPSIRASADVAYGNGTQDAGFLASTINAALAPAVPALPAGSLDGHLRTFDFSAKLTAAPLPGLRLNAAYARNVRNNETSVRAYPQVATDMFIAAGARSNTPFGIWQDRVKANAEYRGFAKWALSGGIDWDQRHRNYQEVVQTRETTAWARASTTAVESLALAFNLAYADRSATTQGVAYWFGAAQNPLMRKFNLAPRQRTTAGFRGDWTIAEEVTLGFGADWSNDDYTHTRIGLTESRTSTLYADLTAAVSDRTQVHAYAQGQWSRSRQSGSQAFGSPDWTGRIDDRDALGVGIKHAAIPNRFDLGADLSYARSRSDTSVQTALGEPAFPGNGTTRNALKIYASYKLKDDLWLNGSFWHESYSSSDWQLDGVQPNTVFDLLAFGNPAPRYNVNVFRLSARFQF